MVFWCLLRSIGGTTLGARFLDLGLPDGVRARSESPIGVLLSVLLLCLDSLGFPFGSLFRRKGLPVVTDNLGEIGMIALDTVRNLLATDEGGTKEDEGIGRSWDVV